MRILILGYYGFGNMGDELILKTMIRQIRNRYPNAEITVLSAAPSQTKKNHHVKSVNRWNPLRAIFSLWKTDLLLFGGGGLFQNKTSSRTLVYYLGALGFARLVGCPVVIYALGVEPIKGWFWKRVIRATLNQKQVKVTVRDAGSKDDLVSMGVRSKAVDVTADPVFAYPVTDHPRTQWSRTNPSLLFVPRLPCPDRAQRLYSLLLKVAQNEMSAHIKTTLFHLALEKRHLREAKDFPSLFSLENADQTIGLFDGVISARFHACVLALLSDRPFVGVGDFHKVGRLCEEWGMPFLPWSADEWMVRQALYAMMASSSLKDRLQPARQAAEKTVDYIEGMV